MKARAVAIVALVTLQASLAFSQERPEDRFVPRVIKGVLLDPTTYVPTILAWKATNLDWESSQVFFQNGFVEHNPGFTVSGRADDTAIGYAAGNRQIFADAFTNLSLSLAHNAGSRVVERLLQERYPHRRKLVRAIGWIERSAMASYLSYRLSAGHFRQWQSNKAQGFQLGY